MEKKVLVFETHVGEGGHHLEYLNHLYLKAVEVPETSFVFAVPEEFEETKKKFTWPQSENISFDFIDDAIVNRIRQLSGLRYCYQISKLASKYIKKHKANETFLISLINYVLFLPFLISCHSKISGILYYVYLYDWKWLNWRKRIEQVLVYLIMTNKSNFKNLFVLNDSSAAAYYNKLYRTNRFSYVPDPVLLPEQIEYKDANLFSRPHDAKVFLQCGMMSRRKMTIKILDTIESLSGEDGLFFLFTGKIQKDIKEEFYKKYEAIKECHNIYVKDNHLSYEEMSFYLDACDYVFILYAVVAQSSGFLGHAALHRKPVIAYNRGMIGKLVRKYHLGYTISDDSPVALSHVLHEYAKTTYYVSDRYIITHQVKDFTKHIFEK